MAAGGAHLDHLGLALAHLLHDDAGVFLVDVDHNLLDRLLPLAGRFVLLQDDARTRYRQFKAFPAHGLDQDGELQFAAARDFHGILVGGFGHAQRDIALGLAQQAVADHAAGHLVAFGAGERRVVDDERHRYRRRIDRLRLQRRIDGRIAECIGDGALGEAGNGDDVAGFGLFQRRALNAAKRNDFCNPPVLDQSAVAAQHLDGLIGLDAA